VQTFTKKFGVDIYPAQAGKISDSTIAFCLPFSRPNYKRT